MIKTEYKNIEEIHVDPLNPRLIKDDQFKKLCESIEKNKDYFEARPILVNPEGKIFAGTMRYRAARFLNMTEVPVAVMDISEERQREILLKDNLHSGEFDWTKLNANYDADFLFEVGFTESQLGGQIEETEKGKKLITCPKCGEEFEAGQKAKKVE